MTFRAFGPAAFAAAIAISTLPAYADFKDNKPVTFSVDGATATGYFKVVTEAINGIVREVYPGTAATYKPGSPAGGILNISRGTSDFTFNAGATEVGYALDGKAPFTESQKGKFQFVMLLHSGLIMHSLMTKEWADKNGVKSFADIAAKKPHMRLTVNTLANLQSTVSMYQSVFDAYGIKEDEVTKGSPVFRSNAAGGFDAIRDGKIDVFINGGFLPTAEIIDIARGRPLMWIVGDPVKNKAAADRWTNTPIKVPKATYPFMTEDGVTIALWNSIVAGTHVSEETVYKFVKALAENQDRVRAIHPTLGQFDIRQLSANPTQLQYHPGAARYYREVGLLK